MNPILQARRTYEVFFYCLWIALNRFQNNVKNLRYAGMSMSRPVFNKYSIYLRVTSVSEWRNLLRHLQKIIMAKPEMRKKIRNISSDPLLSHAEMHFAKIKYLN